MKSITEAEAVDIVDWRCHINKLLSRKILAISDGGMLANAFYNRRVITCMAPVATTSMTLEKLRYASVLLLCLY